MDLRIPSGAFFLLLGGILLAMGVAAPSARSPLGGVNVNMYAGSAVALFGGILLWLAKRPS
jgi:hypothetical protein